MLKALHSKKGFTLIELLIVVAIIAILAAIAIPQFGAYRARAVRSSMVADSKNIATSMETMFQDCSTYLAATGFTVTGPGSANLALVPASCTGNTGISPIMVAASRGNIVAITPAATSWTMTVTNTGGDDNSYTGPLQRDSTGACSWKVKGGAC